MYRRETYCFSGLIQNTCLNLWYWCFCIAFLGGVVLTSCHSGNTEEDERYFESDTLHAAILYSTVSYFELHGQAMGADYELLQNLAAYLERPLKLHVATSETDMINMLERGRVELVACEIPQTFRLLRYFRFVFPQSESEQVLLQKRGRPLLTSVTQLIGKDEVCVIAGSVYQQRLEHLNKELGGGMNIRVLPDSLIVEDLIALLLTDSIAYTPVFRDLALLYKNYYPDLDASLSLSFGQKRGWLLNNNSELIPAIEMWQALPQTRELQAQMKARFLKRNPYLSASKIKIPQGAISPYDAVFKKYALEIDWDWRMLAALAFVESGFDSSEVSVAGAVGIMQLMPVTAMNFGLDESSFFNPSKNIKAGVDYIKKLDKIFDDIENKEERKNFIMASYNSGPAHVLDAMALADKYGKSAHLWADNVEYFLLKKNDPEFYGDSVVKYGTFRGAETVKHVKRVQQAYEKYLNNKK